VAIYTAQVSNSPIAEHDMQLGSLSPSKPTLSSSRRRITRQLMSST
jgi:hypothetical protein